MVSKNTKKVTNGGAVRLCRSWIGSFLEHTNKLGSPKIYRKWSAIAAIAGTLQQKVSITTVGKLYPNLYVFLVGGPGMGKSIAVNAVAEFVRHVLPKESIGATSMTMASMTDYLVESRRIIPLVPGPALEYNSLFVFADELSAFMNDWKGQNDLVAGLTKYYDCSPYSQGRRTTNIRIALENPQINILTGSTPSNLMRFIPDWAWDQGFTSRIILIYCGAKPDIDIFQRSPKADLPEDMIHDLTMIDQLCGEFGWTDDYAEAMNKWQESGYEPAPTHPKLAWYNERRRAHMLKLSMVASVDRSNDLMVTVDDYKTALEWLIEAEHFMPDIFRVGTATVDSKAMEEIHHFISAFPNGVPEHKIKNFAIGRLPAPWILQGINVMEQSGLIKCVSVDKSGQRVFKVVDQSTPGRVDVPIH